MVLILGIVFATGHFSPAATLVFSYLDPAGVGFNDAALGAARRAALEDVGNQLGAMLGGVQATVLVHVAASQFDGTGALASGSIRYPNAATLPSGIWGGRFHQLITTGVDGNGVGNPETIMTWDLGRDWYLGEDPAGIGSSQFDFRSVALHELTHGMGLASAIEQNGSGFRGNAPGTPDVFTLYDSLLGTGAGVPLIGPSSAFDLSTVASLTANDIYFYGANAMAANGGLPVPVYSPSIWDSGSSLSHIGTFGDPMYYGIVRGDVNRSWSAVDIGVLQDLGYVIVPEPTTMLLLGMGCWVLLLAARGRNPRLRDEALRDTYTASW